MNAYVLQIIPLLTIISAATVVASFLFPKLYKSAESGNEIINMGIACFVAFACLTVLPSGASLLWKYVDATITVVLCLASIFYVLPWTEALFTRRWADVARRRGSIMQIDGILLPVAFLVAMITLALWALGILTNVLIASALIAASVAYLIYRFE